MSVNLKEILHATAEAVVTASTRYTQEQLNAYKKALSIETEENSRWILEMIIENAEIANKEKIPLCDDTGIPHVLLEIGDEAIIEGNPANILAAVEDGVALGLKNLPGRPMAVKGNNIERITQGKGLSEKSEDVLPAPIRIKAIKGCAIRVTVLMLGGGPEIRSRTYRVFHRHNIESFSDEIASWAVEMAGLLGCTPCVPAIGVGRTHYEATCMMLDAMTYGEFGQESELEKNVTAAVNASQTGPLGIGGKITAIQSFIKVGPQRASGIRVVCLRTGCLVDPRRASNILE